MVSFFLALGIEDYMLPCFSKKILGIDCPGCGLQRGMAFLLKGDFLAAWEIYPAIFTILPLLGVFLLQQFVQMKHLNKITIVLVITSVILILTNYILKFI